MVLPFIFGAANAGLGIFQGWASAQAQQQDYLNQKAYSEATAQFNRWQAGFNQKLNNENAQYDYWARTVNYNSELAYTGQLRNWDLSQEIAQAERVRDTRVAASTNFVVSSEALSQRFAEEGMQRAVGIQQAQYRMLQQSKAFQAMNTEGNSSDRIINDYTRQIGDYETLASINESLKKRQYSRDQLSQVAGYLSQYNSQDFLKVMDRVDPIAPFPPLPSLVTPPGPSMVGGAPGGLNGLQIGTGIMGGINAGINMANQIKNLK
jgi:hypothetical protein